MAVLVQQMVPASASGVAFTADPVTGDRGVVRVNAIKGLGERLVSMTADADEWRCARSCHAAAPEQAVSEGTRVARLARRVEALRRRRRTSSGPTRGRVHLLQARPITALPKLAFTAPAPGGCRDFASARAGRAARPVRRLGHPGLEQSFWRELTVRTSRRPRPTHVVVHGWYFASVSFWPESLARTLLTLVARRRMFRVFAQGAPPLAMSP
jgi:pyruvate,water dikinase